MSIKPIATEDLRRMSDKEGIVFQGCGGDPQEWLDGINVLLTDEGILKTEVNLKISAFLSTKALQIFFFPLRMV